MNFFKDANKVTFRDVHGWECYVSEAEHNSQPALWLGQNGHPMKLNRSLAISLIERLKAFVQSPINETPSGDSGVELVARTNDVVRVYFKTPDQARRFEEFMQQEVCHAL